MSPENTPGAEAGRCHEQRWVLDCGSRYWQEKRAHVEALPLPRQLKVRDGDFQLRLVTLPDWCAAVGVEGRLLAFDSFIVPGDEPEWQRCDWIAIAFHMLALSPERAHEAEHGPTLSYSFRLSRRLVPLFEHAWVNRIFLFLRRWAAHEAGESEEALFGPLPKAEIILTHDLDAIRLTPEIRLKQGLFQTVNAARALAKGKPAAARRSMGDAGRYVFSRGDFRTLTRVREMERAAGLKSVLHVYGGRSGLNRGSLRRMLIDPSYDVGTLAGELRQFRDDGHEVGLHQSFDAWESAAAMEAEKQRVEQVLGSPITHCRQHWLHFSLARTWIAQEAAGLRFDSTLGFNDRPGFRGSHALEVSPPFGNLTIRTVPMILMDSHVYDYAGPDRSEPRNAIKPWLDEVRAVRGVASVNWHPHTITSVYGWGSGFAALLDLLA